jgi:eukaryotic-like serine/threonine-protein kinase
LTLFHSAALVASSDPTRNSETPLDSAGRPTIVQADAPVGPAEAPTLAKDSATPEPGGGTIVQSERAARPGGAPVAPPGYEILSELGRGGMGVVHLARDLNLNRFAAIKMIVNANPDLKTQSRFLNEAEVIGLVRHPGIVQVFGFGYCEGQPYFVLEYVEGGSLAQRIARGPRLAPRECAALVRQLADAMAAAHAKGVVHRDLKPSNILVAVDGAPKITDFGIAKLGNSELTVTGAILGTPSYMSPEQAAGNTRDVGTASDIYSLGAILYELLAGRPPLVGESTMLTLRMVVESDPSPLRGVAPGVPRDLETICLRCLRKSPAQRYATAAALADDLRAFLAGEPIAARPTTRAERFLRRCARRPALTATVALLVFVLAVGGPALWSYREWAIAMERAGASDRDRLDQEQRARKAAEELAATQAYYADLNRLQRRVAAPRAGWTWDAAAELERAALAPIAARDPVELRTLLATIENTLDLRRAGTLGAVVRGSGANLAVAPDGAWLAVGDARVGTSRLSCRIRLIRIDAPDAVRELSFPNGNLLNIGRPDGTRALAFSPDGRWLVAGARTGRVHRWDTAAPDAPPATWGEKAAEVAALAFDPDSRAVYTAHRDGEVVRHSLVDTADVRRFQIPTVGRPTGLVFLPDYRPGNDRTDGVRTALAPALLLAGGDGNVLLDPQTLRPIAAPFLRPDGETAKLEPLGTIRYDAANRSLHAARGAGVRSLETRTFSVTATPIAWPDDPIHLRALLATSADGALLATTTEKGRLVVADAGDGSTASISLGDNIYDLAFDPMRARVYLATDDGVLSFEVRRPGHRTTAIRSAEPIARFAPSAADGEPLGTIASAAIRPKWPVFRRWDRTANRWAEYFFEVTNAPLDGFYFEESAQADRAIVCWGRSKLYRVERSNPSVVELARPAEEVTALAVQDDGERFWTAEGAAVHLRAARDGRRIRTWSNLLHATSGRGTVRDIAAGPRSLIVACRDGHLAMLRNDTGEPLREWFVETDTPTVVEQAKDGTIILVGSESGAIHAGSASGGPMFPRRGHDGRIVALAASPAGDWVASASIDGEVVVWKLSGDSLDRIAQLAPSGSRPLRQLRFSTDGGRLFLLPEDANAVQSWDLNALRARARALGLEW